MKKLFLPAICCGLISSLTASAQNVVTWETLGNSLTDDGKPFYTQRFVVDAEFPFDGLAFCIVKQNMQSTNPADTIIEILPGYVVVKSPRFRDAQPNDPITIDIITQGSLQHALLTPDGVHLVTNEKPVNATYIKKRMTSSPSQWVNPRTNADGMIYAEQAYKLNEELKSSYRAEPYKQIPTPKEVILTGGYLNNYGRDVVFEIIPIENEHIDYWEAQIAGDSVIIMTNSAYPQTIVDNVKRRLSQSTDSDGNVPAAMIKDWSDFDYRGFMYDVGRNFFPKEQVKELIDLLSRYGLNTLHFHLGEDEGWRLEIPSLPELTEVGSRRGYTLTDDVPFLKGIYFGNGNPDSPTTANGFYTVEDYIDILQYADSKGITVIPEFDTPGHSRAAIRAMEWRYKKTGDESLRLIHDGDTSVYHTAQAFTDNTMNPALEGPYKFWEIVFDDIIDIYKKAGAPLKAINIGGDEVAAHSWDGSDKAVALMKEKGLNGTSELQAYFVEKIAEIAENKGIKIAGWAEIAKHHSAETDDKLVPVIEAVNSWTYSNKNEIPAFLEKNYPIVMSSVDLLYFDHNYTTHPEEPAMYWGGSITEFSPLHATLDSLVAGRPDLQEKVKGISAQLFSETAQNFPLVEMYILPRLLGLSERAHNGHVTLTDNEYFGLLTQEMPLWAAENKNFYLRQPGITIQNGQILMNEPYGFAQIRYTLDGSEPNRSSTLYTGAIKDNGQEVRAKLFYGPASSFTSILRRQ